MVPVGADQLWSDSGGDGPPLVLSHPGIGDSRVWEPVLPLLSGYRTIRYDARGYGRSPASTEPYTLLDDLVAVLDHYDLGQVTLVGCSMGGGTSIELALGHPARVSALVLACPGIPGAPMSPDPELVAEEEAAAEAGDVDRLIALSARIWAAAGVDDTVTDLLRGAVTAWFSEDGNLQAAEPVFDRLGDITVPAVLLIGDRDTPPVIAANETAATRIPGCQLVRLPGVDHFLPLRAPAAVAAAVQQVRPAT
jgi:pimeloyl-ACP methyl ester carboxylesterase